MKYKYIILDFGNVLAYPITGHWYITKKFMEYIDISKIDYGKLQSAIREHGDILSRKISTLEEEEILFYDFYKSILNDINYEDVSDDQVRDISNYYTYCYDKCKLYDDVEESLKKLSQRYGLLLLSDNWPCGIEIMKYYDVDKYFLKMYISSVYGCLKEDGIFFDYPIDDFNIKPHEALFVDDNEKLLDVATTKDLDVKIMQRKKRNKSKYQSITALNELN